MTQIIGQRGRQFQSESIALFAAMDVQPPYARKILIDNLMAWLNGYGILPLLDVLYIFAAADSQAALLNWVGPTGSYNGVATNAPTFTADQGFTGDSLALAYIETNYNPTTAPGAQVTQNNHCMGFWSLTSPAVGVTVGLNDCGIPTIAMQTRDASDRYQTRSASSSTDSPATANTDGAGLYTLNRTGSSGYRSERNGVLWANITRTSGSLSNASFNVLKRALLSSSSDKQSAAWFCGAALTAEQVYAAYQGIRAYLSGVGAV